jgi:hypothetical protein
MAIAGNGTTALTTVNDCAVLLTRLDGSVVIATRNGASVLKFLPASSESQPVVPIEGGFWVAGYDESLAKPYLWLMTRDDPVQVTLPADFLSIDALVDYGGQLLMSAEVGDPSQSESVDTLLVTVTADGHVTTLRTFDDSGINALATDGNQILGAGLRDGGTVFAVHYTGHDWHLTTLGAGGLVSGAAINGGTMVVSYETEVDNGIPDALVTALSRGGGAWKQTSIKDGYGTSFLGSWNDTVIGDLSIPGSSAMLYCLTPSNSWQVLPGSPDVDENSYTVFALASDGYWVSHGDTLSYSALPAACPA